jgi:hypothetical protein
MTGGYPSSKTGREVTTQPRPPFIYSDGPNRVPPEYRHGDRSPRTRSGSPGSLMRNREGTAGNRASRGGSPGSLGSLPKKSEAAPKRRYSKRPATLCTVYWLGVLVTAASRFPSVESAFPFEFKPVTTVTASVTAWLPVFPFKFNSVTEVTEVTAISEVGGEKFSASERSAGTGGTRGKSLLLGESVFRKVTVDLVTDLIYNGFQTGNSVQIVEIGVTFLGVQPRKVRGNHGNRLGKSRAAQKFVPSPDRSSP